MPRDRTVKTNFGFAIRKLLALFLVVTLVSVIPFLILGESFEEQVRSWFESDFNHSERFALIVGLLAIDIAIPIPSSAVSTYGGTILGLNAATLASWLGLMLGSLSGFVMARWCGASLIKRFASVEDLQAMHHFMQRFSLWTIVFSRPLPILAEATILLCGVLKLSWRQLLLPLALSNFLLAFAYSAIGAWAVEKDVTLYVILASMFLPLLLTLLVRRLVQSTT